MPNLPCGVQFYIDGLYNLYYDELTNWYIPVTYYGGNGGPRIMQERSLYKTIRDDLLRAIENGSLQPDQALPSERELCQRYGTSRMTVRHAVTELESLGSVYRMQGKGTFVSGRKLIQPLMQVSGFTEDMAKRGKKPSSQILFAGEKKADAAIARGLRIAPGEPYILIRRLRLADGVPMAIENTALNASLCRGVLDTDLKNHSLYAALTSRGLALKTGEQYMEAALADAAQAKLLDIPEGAPVLLIERHVTNPEGVTVEVTYSAYRGDSYRFYIEFDGVNRANTVSTSPKGISDNII